MNTIDEYVARVREQLPRCLPEAARIETDLRSHLADRLDAGEREADAVMRMGAPEEVAREFLAPIELRLSTRLRRVGAFLIDAGLGLLLLAPILVAWVVMDGFSPGEGFAFVLLLVLAGVVPVMLSIVYFPATEAIWGQTLGKRLAGICVVRENGERIGWGAAILRRIPWYIELFWLDALFALFTERRQRAFDMVAKTIVIDVRPRHG